MSLKINKQQQQKIRMGLTVECCYPSIGSIISMAKSRIKSFLSSDSIKISIHEEYDHATGIIILAPMYSDKSLDEEIKTPFDKVIKIKTLRVSESNPFLSVDSGYIVKQVSFLSKE